MSALWDEPSAKEIAKFRAWQKTHDCPAAVDPLNEDGPKAGIFGGGHAFIIEPTTIGTGFTFKCFCGEKFDFTDIDGW